MTDAALPIWVILVGGLGAVVGRRSRRKSGRSVVAAMMVVIPVMVAVCTTGSMAVPSFRWITLGSCRTPRWCWRGRSNNNDVVCRMLAATTTRIGGGVT
jgi:hypothetical protein